MHHSGRIIGATVNEWICPLLPARRFWNLSLNACIDAAALFRIWTMPGCWLFASVLVGWAVWGGYGFRCGCVCVWLGLLLSKVLFEYLLKPTLTSIGNRSIVLARTVASHPSTWRIFRRCDRYGLLLLRLFDRWCLLVYVFCLTSDITEASLT